MAGKRHHIIPRFLMKGFASKTDGDEVFTWVYRKGVEPYETNTKNVNVEKNYYGKTGETSADDEITNVETSQFAPLIVNLRNGECDLEKSKKDIAEMIAHFSIRTKVVREGFTDLSQKMFGEIKNIVTDDHFIENTFLKPPESFVDEQIDIVLTDPKYSTDVELPLKFLEAIGLESKDIKELIRSLTSAALEAQESKNQIKTLVDTMFSEGFERANEAIPDSVKAGHIKSLAENTVPKPRAQKYETLNWTIVQTEKPLVLGDVLCLFRDYEHKALSASYELENIAEVYLPISTNKLLVGSTEEAKVTIDEAFVNKAMIGHSFEQFIFFERSAEMIEMSQQIATDFYLANEVLVDEELEKISTNIKDFYKEDGT